MTRDEALRQITDILLHRAMAFTRREHEMLTHETVDRMAVLLDACLATREREAIERAAKVAEDVARVEYARTIGVPTTGEYQIGARNAASAIRALLPPCIK